MSKQQIHNAFKERDKKQASNTKKTFLSSSADSAIETAKHFAQQGYFQLNQGNYY